ncbi:MAG: exodeoxyribonuclease small subunit [Burkholderiales bacterium]|jgi:exodeoxyribonuclease VII small subunit|nr:exodeoxyribonuclease small subunit [Burkholderiales bacterium]
MVTKTKSPADFEEAMAELEQIVLQIENNEVKLETALEKYQLGMALIKFCQEKLAEVEQKVKILDTDTDSLKDFNVV